MQGIKELLKANHANYIADEDKKDGFVTTNLTDEQLHALIVEEDGVTIAKDQQGNVLAFALAAPWKYWSQWPMFQYMMEILEEYQIDSEKLNIDNSYQYGPVCLDKSVRGTGVFEEVFRYSLHAMAERYPYMVTFINQVNGRSYAAHTRKAGMTECGRFDFNGNHYYMMAISTK